MIVAEAMQIGFSLARLGLSTCSGRRQLVPHPSVLRIPPLHNRTKQKRPHGRPCFVCCGGGIRTPDLQVMSLTSCRCSTPRYV